ncbi:MAG: hypothetical protein F2563_01120 [Actinobacteria bacterium]|nr:hypothetical protein [Actinomycetota bacterium]
MILMVLGAVMVVSSATTHSMVKTAQRKERITMAGAAIRELAKSKNW